jgi:hypothetical protein
MDQDREVVGKTASFFHGADINFLPSCYTLHNIAKPGGQCPPVSTNHQQLRAGECHDHDQTNDSNNLALDR